METEKSRDLLLASWRTKKASDTVRYEFKGLRIGEVDGISPDLGLQSGEPGAPVS